MEKILKKNKELIFNALILYANECDESAKKLSIASLNEEAKKAYELAKIIASYNPN